MDPHTRTQITRFLIVGIGATCTDAGMYFGLIDTGIAEAVRLHVPNLISTDHDIAKAAAFFVGTVISYALNKMWTFEASGRDGRQAAAFVSLYSATFVLNVAVNHGVLSAGAASGLAQRALEILAFLIATACSTVVNFLGQKFWVFKKPAPPQTSG